MAKKKSWLDQVKRFFAPDKQSKSEKDKRRRRWVFGRLKIKRLGSLEAPLPLLITEEEQSKVTLNVAVAATDDALQLINTETHQCEDQTDEFATTNDPPRSAHQCEREIHEIAAIKIQTTYRGYLARKALRALKGIVKLQAIIRGRAVRRQAITTLKCLQSIVSIQSQVCTKRVQTGEGVWHRDEKKEWQDFKEKLIKMDSESQRRWNDSILSKKVADALILSKKEAAIKRERIKEYSFSHRKSTESEQNKGRWRYWLENWVDTQVSKSKELEDLDSVLTSKRREEHGTKPHKIRNHDKQCYIEELMSPILSRRSVNHKRQSSMGEDNSFTSSPIVPTYMAATKSAKAKARSMSSPRPRSGSFDTCSESYSPYKNKLSVISAIGGEVPTSIGRISSSRQQRSPGLKGIPFPVRSSLTSKDLSFDSEYSFSTWDRQSGFR